MIALHSPAHWCVQHIYLSETIKRHHARIVRCIFIFASLSHSKCISTKRCVRPFERRECKHTAHIVSNIVKCGVVRMTPDIIYGDDYVIRTMPSYEWKENAAPSQPWATQRGLGFSCCNFICMRRNNVVMMMVWNSAIRNVHCAMKNLNSMLLFLPIPSIALPCVLL